MGNDRLQKAAAILKDASEEDLEKIGRLAWDMLRDLRKRSAQMAMLDFSVGDEVENVRGGRRLPVGVLGRVDKIGDRMLSVDFGEFGQWRIAPSLVKKTGKKAKPPKARKPLFGHHEVDPEIVAARKGMV